ncbi:UNVERIFIED_CONTAM: hypothetical protein RKD50_008644 [Streptomyces canus]|jgi:hypothetical protein
MGVDDVLRLWWVLPTGLALLGYGLALVGLSPAQRAVWVTGRIVEVGQPAHGASKHPGIPVTIAFPDPATGQEFVLSNVGKHGDSVEEAWVGREVEVRHPRGRPHLFRVVLHSAEDKNGRSGPCCTVGLLLIGLVIHATVLWGYPWALLGFGALVTALAALSPDIRTARARDALLAQAIAVPARVVAVTRDVYTDGEGGEIINHAPVVTFTTVEGTEVTVLSRDGIPDPSRSLGRRLTIHYAPSDPAVHTPDPAADRRANKRAVGTIIVLLLAGTAAVVTGAILL